MGTYPTAHKLSATNYYRMPVLVGRDGGRENGRERGVGETEREKGGERKSEGEKKSEREREGTEREGGL